MIYVSHDAAEVRRIATRVVMMEAGGDGDGRGRVAYNAACSRRAESSA